MTIYKSTKKIHIPTDQNLTELLHTTARPDNKLRQQAQTTSSDNKLGQHVVFEDDLEGRTITLEQLRQKAGRLAYALNAHYKPVDQSRWAVILPNSATIAEVVHTILWLGGVFCPINHQLLSSEIAHALVVSRPAYIITYGKVIQKIEDAIIIARKTNPGYKPEIITAIHHDINFQHCSLEKDFPASNQLLVPHYADTRDRLASIHLSSGTTGLPKGVGLSQYNYLSNVYQLWNHDPERWNTEESVLSVTPFVHLANGTVPFFLGPWTGVRHIIMSSYEVEKLGKLVEERRPTTVQMLPTILQGVLRSQLTTRYDFSSVKRITGSHGGLKRDEEEQLFGRGKWQPLQMYGLTEAGPWVAVQRVSEHLKKGQMGQLVPGLEGRLITETGADAKNGTSGELWIRGPNVTKGYIDNPEANRNAFPAEGWFNTGDICAISEDGIVSLVGRTKELIKYNSFQVSPNELEVYLLQHPAVSDGAVGPTWDKAKDTEVPTAYVVLNKTFTAEVSTIQVLQDIQTKVDNQF
ncbi:4-coumarate-CoA ligase-like protein 3 [Colletotrichum truncatum]|uniref:4-coumarate-CoA ligase-like protein 3 n=1 Tax=Colletotrichum truncatum TaxID=5467 RepID=A0ACC3YYX5_COLTU|nr:4-coumarate-CoA ligase-like protein 3 [Colletotrichum truncatum]KAF6781754.1 4-coumarate-CoA ligase-like protein 3 [Colletotrichum truncatum]